MSPVLLFIGVLLLVVLSAVLSHRAEKKRLAAFRAVADRLGLAYHPDRDHAWAQSYQFLDPLRQGDNRYARHRLDGTCEGERVSAFEFHYETHSTDSKGRRQTHHHYISVFLLHLPCPFPELTIRPEGLLSKLAQAVGFEDIDFESHEFSRKFCVRSKDKKFAYDFCNARMIELLLAHRDLAIEVENGVLAIHLSRRLDPAQIEPQLRRLLEIRRLMPNYLFPGPRS